MPAIYRKYERDIRQKAVSLLLGSGRPALPDECPLIAAGASACRKHKDS